MKAGQASGDARAVALAAAGTWAASRVALLLVSWASVALQTTTGSLTFGDLLASFNQWDARWYVLIAARGYSTSVALGPVHCPCDGREATAFFPLFPAVAGILHQVIGGADPVLAAVLVANAAALAGTVAVALLALELGGTRSQALASVAALLAYPLAFFTFVPFTEGMFLAFAALALLLARRRDWGSSAYAAFAATLTRPTAVALAAALAWESTGRALPALLNRAAAVATRVRAAFPVILTVGAVAAGLGLYSLYIGAVYGDPLAWSHAHELFHHQQLSMPWVALGIVGHALFTQTPEWRAMIAVDLGSIVVCSLVAVVAARRLPAYLWVYQWVVILLPLVLPSYTFYGDDVLAAASRYMAVSIPVFIILGRWMSGRPWLAYLVVGGGALLQGVMFTRYLSGAWVG